MPSSECPCRAHETTKACLSNEVLPCLDSWPRSFAVLDSQRSRQVLASSTLGRTSVCRFQVEYTFAVDGPNLGLTTARWRITLVKGFPEVSSRASGLAVGQGCSVRSSEGLNLPSDCLSGVARGRRPTLACLLHERDSLEARALRNGPLDGLLRSSKDIVAIVHLTASP